MINDNLNSQKVTALANERYLSFSLGSEEYAVRLLTVKEVIAMPEFTKVPQTPSYFLGIMNLRGQVISVLDLRQKLGIKPNNSAETAVIIFDLKQVIIGVVVDSVNSVLSPKIEDVSETPEIQSAAGADYIEGVFRSEKRLVLFLDIARVLGVDDINAAKGAAGKIAA